MDLRVKIAAGAAAALGLWWLRRRGRSSASAPPELLAASDLAGLEPTVRAMAIGLIAEAHANGIDLVVTDGFRSNAAQAELYAKGRTKPGAIVTYAKPGHSWHNYGRAVDMADYSSGRPRWPSSLAYWRRVGELGEAAGFRWGGRWKHPDYPHFEYHPGISIAAMAQTSQK